MDADVDVDLDAGINMNPGTAIGIDVDIDTETDIDVDVGTDLVRPRGSLLTHQPKMYCKSCCRGPQYLPIFRSHIPSIAMLKYV